MINVDELFATGVHSKDAVGRRVRCARESLGMSQREMGELTGISYQQISNIENGLAYPKLDMLVKLLTGYRIDINFIVVGHHAQLPIDVRDNLLTCARKAYVAEPEDSSN